MPVDSPLNLSLPVAPLTDDPKLAGELQIVYNALNMIVQALNDAGIPSGGTSPSPSLLGVANGGTGAATLTGILQGNGITAISGITSAVVGDALQVTGPGTYAFVTPSTGDVHGPAGATDGALVVFDGATGKIIKEYVPDANGIFTELAGQIITRTSFTFDGSNMVISADYPGGEMSSRITNTNGTGIASSNAVQHINVLEANGGSAFSNYALTGTQEWVAGIDTADNHYRISSGVDFVTGTSRLDINPTTGAVTASGFVGALTGNADTCSIASNITGGGANYIPYQSAANTTGMINVGANVVAFLGTPSSANLRAVLTDETGTGAAVFADKPQFVEGIGLGATAAGAGGIAFPAVAVAIADPNTLDDYEEGTWTPDDQSGAGLALTISSATYTKIGRLVIARAQLTYPATANGSDAYIGGLPFTSANLTGSAGVVNFGYADAVSNLRGGYVVSNTTKMQLLKVTPAGGIANSTLSGATFIFNAIYETA